jgi:hypothetical protein
MPAEIIAGVYGKPGDTDYVFLIPHPVDKQALAYAIDHGLEFCGTMGFIDGQSYCRCQPSMDAVLTMMSAVPAFARYVGQRFRDEAAQTSFSCLA